MSLSLRLGLCASFVAILVVAASSAYADRVKLKNGKVVEGVVIKQPSGYWVKATDGQTYKFEESEVASVEQGPVVKPGAPAAPTPGVAPAPGARAKPGAPGAKPTVVVSFSATRAKCATIDSAVAAVALWQQFIDNSPGSPDLPAAKEELAKWKQLADTGAEKIKGRWVGGEERKQLIAKVRALQKEADDLLQKNQTLQAVKKLEELANLYPNSFETNFTIGFISSMSGNENKAVEFFNKALALQPDNPEALNNVAVSYLFKRQYDKGILMIKKALEQGDRKEIVQNLITAVSMAPEPMRKRKDIKEAEEAAMLLAGKYQLSGPIDTFLMAPLRKGGGGSRSGPTAGSMWSGTGFVIAADGLILTNRHVVEGGKTLMVILQGAGPGGTDLQKSAEVVVIDDQQDLALIRIKVDAGKPMTVLRFSPKDSPADGADCTVIGYPMIDRLGGNVKITRGIVSSAAKHAEGPDVMIDAKVNPGNSGGPIVDRFGNVMAIVSMKTIGSAMEDTYGLGISCGMVRKFLEKNSIKVTPGTATGAPLSAEDIAAKAKPSTVCILGTNK